MKIKEYFVDNFSYNLDIEAMKKSGKNLFQFMSITATKYTDRQLEISFNIMGKDNEDENNKLNILFEIKAKFIVKYSEKIKNFERDEIEKYVKLFYPNFEEFITEFYQKQTGLKNLVAPEF